MLSPRMSGAQSAAPQGQSLVVPVVGHGVNPAYIDTTCAVCRSLYNYASGAWLKTATIPAEYPGWGAFFELYERNLSALHGMLDSLSTADLKSGTPEWKVAHFYHSCMDSARAESDGASPLRAELSRIDGITNRQLLEAEVARLHRAPTGALFFFTAAQDAKRSDEEIADASQGGLGLPDRDYYFRADTAAARTRREYAEHIARTLELAGTPAASATAQAKRIMALETKLADASMTIVEQRDPNALYHRMTVAELAKITPHWSWPEYFREIGRPDIPVTNMRQPKFFAAVDGMLVSVPLSDWKSYLRWQYIAAAAPFLSTPFVKEDFSFNGALLGGATELRPRWKRCLTQTDGQLGEALGQVYVARAFTPETKAKALSMVQNLEAVLHDDLSTLSWMSDATRKQAIVKLDAFVNKMGYPDKWRDYTLLVVHDGPFWHNVVAGSEFNFHRRLMKIDKPVDRSEWGMTPPTVNAEYNPNHNDLEFPAGILQPPFFDPDADDASNYGAIGTVIGHEMTHGFDDQGRQFDAQGNLRDWWTATDAAEYKKRAAIVVAQYNQDLVIDTIHVNGEQTLGENIADIGGTKLAYAALERSLKGKPRPLIDGFTPEQRFFIAYAQQWRELDRPEFARTLVQTNVHSPSQWRIDSPVANMPEFAQAFHCLATDALVRPDSMRAQIW